MDVGAKGSAPGGGEMQEVQAGLCFLLRKEALAFPVGPKTDRNPFHLGSCSVLVTKPDFSSHSILLQPLAGKSGSGQGALVEKPHSDVTAHVNQKGQRDGEKERIKEPPEQQLPHQLTLLSSQVGNVRTWLVSSQPETYLIISLQISPPPTLLQQLDGLLVASSFGPAAHGGVRAVGMGPAPSITGRLLAIRRILTINSSLTRHPKMFELDW
nr:uncharacterized protein LOC116148215 [Camelus dromedarius]